MVQKKAKAEIQNKSDHFGIFTVPGDKTVHMQRCY